MCGPNHKGLTKWPVRKLSVRWLPSAAQGTHRLNTDNKWMAEYRGFTRRSKTEVATTCGSPLQHQACPQQTAHLQAAQMRSTGSTRGGKETTWSTTTSLTAGPPAARADS